MTSLFTASRAVRMGPAMAMLCGAMTALLGTSAAAQATVGASFDPGSAVAVIVKVPKPWYAPRWVVVTRMRNTVAEYEALPGLAYKAYSFSRPDGDYGGIYLWKDAASARAWFSPAWFARVGKERAAKADVRWFEVLAAIDNPVGAAAADGVGTLVTLPAPAGIDKARLRQEFEAAVPLYRGVPGLRRKYFIVTDDGRFGGIYLWQDAASAQQWFDAAWHERSRRTYGSEPSLEWFDTPILTPSKLDANQARVPGLIPTAATTGP